MAGELTKNTDPFTDSGLVGDSVSYPYVFGPPGSGSVVYLYRVPGTDPDSSINKQKMKKKRFGTSLQNLASRRSPKKRAGSGAGSVSQSTDPRIRIRTKMLRIIQFQPVSFCLLMATLYFSVLNVLTHDTRKKSSNMPYWSKDSIRI